MLDKVNARPECEFQEDLPQRRGTTSNLPRFTASLAVSVPAAGTPGAAMKVDIKSFLIGALLVAVAFLGYLYWDRQRNTVEIKLPSFSIEKR